MSDRLPHIWSPIKAGLLCRLSGQTATLFEAHFSPRPGSSLLGLWFKAWVLEMQLAFLVFLLRAT
jgi:hypothetical protein